MRNVEERTRPVAASGVGRTMSTVGVIGAGYVGLTTAACLAHLGHDVTCADIDEERVRCLHKGELPILEERLPVLVSEGVETKRLRFVVGAALAAAGADVVFLAVPTPQGDDGAADLSCLDAAVREIAPELSPGAVVVTKSTVPVGTARRIQRLLDEAGATEARVASNPEFLREGSAVRDFLKPDRIVIGCDDPSTAVTITDLYRDVHSPTLVTDLASAELIKYAANGYLATRISFVNAISALCEAAGADVHDVALGMGYDQRIGSHYLKPGPGYGGSCLPKDVSALTFTAREMGVELPPLLAAQEVNRTQRARVTAKIVNALEGNLAGATVAVWGLTFKANTDDLRDSPAMEIVGALAARGARVRAYDPVAGEEASQRLRDVSVVADAYEACEGADVLAVLTEWDEFRWADFTRVAEAMRGDQIVDGRNLLDASRMRQIGFGYRGVGR